MDFEIRGQAALVTGASRGIGRAIALALADEGCNVAVCARGEEQLHQVANEIATRGVRGVPILADITSVADLERLVAGTISALGRLDVLVVNAGGSRHPRAASATDDDWLDGISRNILQLARLARIAYPHLRESRGRVIVTASIWGRESGGSVIYNAVKAAQISMASQIAREWAADGIRVNALCPGSTLFPGGSWARRVEADPDGMAAFVAAEIPSGRFGTPEEVAAMAVFLASPRSSWVTGTAIPVDGGQSRTII